MSGSLFDQYKAALRRGHMAALSGALDDALAAYDEAARLVPGRPLPLASRGTVLHRLDRWPEAAAAFDAALALAPDDEAALRARAAARAARDLRSDAAADYERLAFVLDVAGRSREAAEAARRAVDLEPSDARDSLLRRLDVTVARRTALLGEASSGPVDVPAPEGILADGLPALDAADRAAAGEAAADAEEPASEAQPSPPTVASDTPRSQAYDALDALRAGIATKEDGDADSAAGESVDPAADVAAEPAGAGAAEAAAPGDPAPSTDEGVETDGQRVDAAEEPGADRPWPPIDLPSPPTPPIVGPPPDPEALLAEAALVLESSEIDAARDLMLTAVQVHREAGRLDAALEVCLDLLAIAPGDPRVHLAIANLQLDRGWTGVATEKIDLLVRLTSLTGDTQAEADVHGLASERLRDDPATTPAGH